MKLDDKYIYGHCVDPVNVQVWNPISKCHEQREVPCGKCLHCRMTKVNEWKTRLYLQSLYSKYTYSCTFTYDINKMSTESLVDTFATMTYSNYKQVNMLTPIALCKSHMQKFFKRLRKTLPDLKLQYFLVGEYGSKWSHPHYHAILWSNIPLVEFDDILNEEFHLKETNILSRTWNMGIVSAELLNNQILQGFKGVDNAIGYLTKYILKNKQDLFSLTTKLQHLQNIKTIKENENPDFEISDISSEDVAMYWKQYGNFFSCSKRPALATGYLEEYKAKYQDGQIKLHGVHEKSLLLPSYFVKKSKQYVCPYVQFSTQKNNQLSNISCEILGQNIINILRNIKIHTNTLSTLQETLLFRNLSKEEVLYKRIGKYNFKDLSSGEYYIFTFYENKALYVRYKYNRHYKEYEYKGIAYVDDVLRCLVSSFENLKAKILYQFNLSRLRNEQEFKVYLKQHFDDDMNKFIKERDRIYKNLQNCNITRQGKYKLTKINF